MINKNRFSIKNTKKVLHKVGKRWVVVSAVLLGLVAGGAAVTTQANAANTSVGVPAASAPATTGESQQEQENADASKAINKFKSLHQKGYVNEALNGINNRLRPKLNNTNAINGYNNLTSMAQANNLVKFSAGSGEPLGSANSASGSNSSDNTWFGTLQEAENDVNAIHGSVNSSSRYAKALNMINNLVNTTIPANPNYTFTTTINPNTDLSENQKQTFIRNEANDVASQINVPNIDYGKLLQNINNGKIKAMGLKPLSLIGTPTIAYVNGSLSMPSNTVTLQSISSNVTVSGKVNMPKEKISHIINKGVTLNPDVTATVPSVTVHLNPNTVSAKYKITARINIPDFSKPISYKGMNIGTQNEQDLAKDALEFKGFTVTSAKDRQGHVILNEFDVSTVKPGSKTLTLANKSFTNQKVQNVPVTVNVGPFTNYDFNTSTIANIIDGSHYDTDMKGAIETEAHNQINQRVLGFVHHNQAKATNLERLAADAIHAGDFMLDNTAMRTNYNGIVNSLAGLRNDKTSAEFTALNSIYSEASSLANSYGDMPDNSYDNPNNKTSFIGYLNHAANAASSAATSIKDNTAKLTADSRAMPTYIGKVNEYSATLSTDMHYGGKPATNNVQASMNAYKTDVSNNDVNIINNASNAYASWADTDDAFNVTNANDASTDASNMASISGKAAKLVNVNFTAPISYVDGSKSISSSNVSSSLSNPSSAVTSVPTLKVTSMPTNYKLSSGANNTITLNGSAQSIQVVPIDVHETINLVNQPNNSLVSSEAFTVPSGTYESISLPTGYRLAAGYSSNIDVKAGSSKIDVVKPVTETINFVNGGQTVSASSFNGDYGAAFIHNESAPAGYKFSNSLSSSNVSFTFANSNSSSDVNVVSNAPKATSVTDNVVFSGYNVDGSASSSAVSGSVNTSATVSAPANYHFTSNDDYSLNNASSNATFNLSNRNHEIKLNVVPDNYTDTIHINGSYASNTTANGAYNTTGSVIASNGYHFISNGNSYSLSNNASDATFTFTGNNTINVKDVSNASITPITNNVTEYIHFDGDSAANTSMNSASGAHGNVHAPANYHFTSGSASNASFMFSNNGTATFNVASDIVKETIHFNGDNNASSTVSGTYDQKGSVSAPNGYTFSNNSTESYFNYGISDGSMTMNVSKSVAPTVTTSVTDTIIFNGDNNYHESIKGNANTYASVSAPANYHFTSGSASEATFNLGSSAHNVVLNVASNGSKSSSTASSASNSTKPNVPGSTASNNSAKSSNASSSAESTGSNASKSIASNSSSVPASSNTANNFVPPFIFSSSAASSSASASVKPSSASAKSASVKSHSAEPKSRVANYVMVTRALQLHTNPNFTKKNGVIVVKPGTRLDLEKPVRVHRDLVRYEVKYNDKDYFVTANKKFTSHISYTLAKPTHYRYFKVDKALQLHTSPNFNKKNGVIVVKPGAEFRINRVIKAHGAIRYEISYKGNVYFVTANKGFTANAYLQKSNFNKRGRKLVRVTRKLSEYKKINFAKRSFIRSFHKGAILSVKRVITIARGEMTRLQLTNGHYVTSNKNLVKVIK